MGMKMPAMNQVRLKENACSMLRVAVEVTVGVRVKVGIGVSLAGGVTRAPPISAFSVPNRSRPGVTGAVDENKKPGVAARVSVSTPAVWLVCGEEVADGVIFAAAVGAGVLLPISGYGFK